MSIISRVSRQVWTQQPIIDCDVIQSTLVNELFGQQRAANHSVTPLDVNLGKCILS